MFGCSKVIWLRMMIKSHRTQIHKHNSRTKVVSDENKNADEVYLIRELTVYKECLSGSISFINFKENKLYLINHKYTDIKVNTIIDSIEITTCSFNDNKSISITVIHIVYSLAIKCRLNFIMEQEKG